MRQSASIASVAALCLVFAAAHGYTSETLALVPDSFERPTYQVFRFRGR